MNPLLDGQLTLALGTAERDTAWPAAPAQQADARVGEPATGGILTGEQELAVGRRRGALLVAAGAGSGKTAVLVERFVRAVLVDGVTPARILAITFTDRAAGELTQRLRRRFLELDEREHARDVEAALVGTFHTFCARLLRLNSLAAGVDPDFVVLDESRAARLRIEAFQRALAEMVAAEREDGVELLAAYGAPRLREMVLGVHAELRSRGAERPRLPLAETERVASERQLGAERPGPGDAAPDALAVCALLDGLLAGFGGHYESLKSARGALDFDDLELRGRSLLERHAHLRASWRERLELLMVDELQDVNHRQVALLELLERENLFTVGDELQSIYGFRHADVELFRRRKARLATDGAALELTHNFRARSEVLLAINTIFAPRFGAAYTPLQCGRDSEPACDDADPAVELLLTDREWGRHGLASDGESGGVPAWRRAEAQMLAQRIADLIGEGSVRARDVAVLMRATTGLDVYAQALEEQGIATLAAVGGFWSHQQVRDLVAYLRVLANPRDELALYGALASPLAGLSPDGLALLARAGRGGRGWDAARRLVVEPGALASTDRERLSAFCALLEGERVRGAFRGIAGTLRHALAVTGYERHVRAMPAAERRIANIRKLIRIATRFERDERGDLRGFLDHAAAAEQALGRLEPHAPVADEELEAVRLMTIHAAKGLEFPVVCVPELGARPNLRIPDLLVDGSRLGVRLLRLGAANAQPALAFAELSDARRCAQEREEDRILYVALTRAKERLLLGGVVNFKRWPQRDAGCAPIAWLGPALVPDIARRVLRATQSPQAAEGPSEQERSTEEPTTEEPIWIARGPAGGVRCWLNAPPTLGRVLREGSMRPLARALTSEHRAERPEHRAERPEHRADPPPDAECNTPRDRGTGALTLPGTLSYTALTKLDRCAYRYYLEDVLRMPEAQDRTAAARRDAVGARARGQILHRALESFDFAGRSVISAEQVGELGHELGVRIRARECTEIAALLAGLRGTAVAARLAAEGLRREQPFAFLVDAAQPLITGVIDASVSDPCGHHLVVDYKSDRVAPEENLPALVRREYELQRVIYALAALRSGAREVEVAHWFLQRPDEPVTATFAARDEHALETKLRRLIEAAHDRGHAVSAKPGRDLCAGCPGRGTLCSWPLEQTLGPSG
jgi:ATP-dependent exoDNAse (exonuclease V) beta subunit